jgi:hypothetical protein
MNQIKYYFDLTRCLWTAEATFNGKTYKSGSRKWRFDARDAVCKKVFREVGAHRYEELGLR